MCLHPGRFFCNHLTRMLYRCGFFLVHLYLSDMNVWKIVHILHACIQLSISVFMWNVHAENCAFNLLIIFTLNCSHLWAARCFPLRYDGDIQSSSYSKKAGASSWLRKDTEWISLILSICMPCVPCLPWIPRACLSHTTRLSAYGSAWHVLRDDNLCNVPPGLGEGVSCHGTWSWLHDAVYKRILERNGLHCKGRTRASWALYLVQICEETSMFKRHARLKMLYFLVNSGPT